MGSFVYPLWHAPPTPTSTPRCGSAGVSASPESARVCLHPSPAPRDTRTPKPELPRVSPPPEAPPPSREPPFPQRTGEDGSGRPPSLPRLLAHLGAARLGQRGASAVGVSPRVADAPRVAVSPTARGVDDGLVRPGRRPRGRGEPPLPAGRPLPPSAPRHCYKVGGEWGGAGPQGDVEVAAQTTQTFFPFLVLTRHLGLRPSPAPPVPSPAPVSDPE